MGAVETIIMMHVPIKRTKGLPFSPPETASAAGLRHVGLPNSTSSFSSHQETMSPQNLVNQQTEVAYACIVLGRYYAFR
jgi:hypothetical protein